MAPLSFLHHGGRACRVWVMPGFRQVGRGRERERERGEEMVYGYKFQMKYMRLTCSNYYLRLIKLYYIPEYFILVILYHLKTKIVQKKKKP
jgi:hypothetical protein